MFKIDCFGATYKNQRYNNEDNYYITKQYAELQHENEKFKKQFDDKIRNIFGVFDGLGGEDKGETASYYAAKTLSEFDLRCEIDRFYMYANEKICSLRTKNSSKMSGTTAVLIDIYNGKYICSNIGDSRAYLIRNNQIKQLSKDHTSMQMMIDSGVMTKEQLKNSKYHNVLSQCLGMNDDEIIISPYITETAILQDKDIFLICSDGLTGSLSNNELKDIILNTSKDSSVTDILFDAAVKGGARDNVTMMLIYVNEEKSFVKVLSEKFKDKCFYK